ncbi:MAG: hypothetical protein ACFFG0_33910 [Candidatus Thorarchaeota archaeon]
MTTNVLKKGLNAELKTAAYFQARGYLVRRGVTLSVSSGTKEATDIDLLGIRFGTFLDEERLVVDCKDRKKPRPFERVLWTLGVSSFSEATKSVVVLPKAPWQAREFASRKGIKILETRKLDELLKTVGNTFPFFSDANQKFTLKLDSLIKSLSELDKELLREDLKLKQMLIVGHPITNLNRIIDIISKSGKFISGASDSVSQFKRCLCYNAAIIASIMLVRFAAESIWTPKVDWSDYARKKLTYGDVSPEKARKLAKLAYSQDFHKGLPEPEYMDEIIELIKDLISKPEMTALIPFFLDFRLFGSILGEIPEKTTCPLIEEKQEELNKIGKRILSTLSFAAKIDSNLWDCEKKL